MFILEVVRQRKPVELRHGIETLLAAAQQMSDWRDWYVRHEPLIAELFGADAPLFGKLLAATSQRAKVHSNVGLALKAYQQYKRGEPFVGYLQPVAQNLERIRQDQQLSGRKIGQFGNALAQGGDNIAVDQHIGELFFGEPRPSRAQVEKAKETINLIAQKLGWPPREVQATLWAYNKLVRGEKPQEMWSYTHSLTKMRDQITQIRQALAQINQAPIAA